MIRLFLITLFIIRRAVAVYQTRRGIARLRKRARATQAGFQKALDELPYKHD